MTEVVLLVNGTRYGGWQEIDVQRSMRAISGRFSLTLSERFPGNPTRWPVSQGDACALIIGGQTVITGYVDTRQASFSASDHTVNVTGRDRSADLVDCAPEIGTYELAGVTALQLAQRLAKPFSVPISSQIGGLKTLDKFDIQPGETAFDCINRACQLSAVLPIPQGDGSVVLEREGRARAGTDIREGDNVLSMSLRRSLEQRFHRYVVAGQHFGTDTLNGEDAATPRAEATDPNVRESRVLYLRPSGNLSAAQAQERADWESANRAASSVEVSATLQGWTQRDGRLWEINRVVRVVSDTLSIDADMLIVSVSFTLNAQGTRTALTLAPLGSFRPDPVQKESASDGKQTGIGWGDGYD